MRENPEELIGRIAPGWGWHRPPGIHTDPIGMEYAIGEMDPDVRSQLRVVRLQAHAKIHQTVAEAASKAAEILSKK